MLWNSVCLRIFLCPMSFIYYYTTNFCFTSKKKNWNLLQPVEILNFVFSYHNILKKWILCWTKNVYIAHWPTDLSNFPDRPAQNINWINLLYITYTTLNHRCNMYINPLPALTHQSALDLNAPCRPKRTETHWLSSS
jgi:hypothetical protein